MGEIREVWAKRVERLADSGLTVREFAAEIGVNPNTLAGWKWRLGAGQEPAAKTAPPTSVPTFLELVTTAPASESGSRRRGTSRPTASAEPLEVVLQSGVRIRVPVAFDPGALRRLVDALEAR